MSYPFWDVGIGYGFLMALIAIPHVFVSHFAIGGGLYLVVAEIAARRAGDSLRLEFLHRLSKFFILVTLVFGAVTGVGIWFIIGLLNPTATEALIHNFVWGWATEWTFFVIEICAAMVYFYGWRKMSATNHLIVGWIYFWAAWMSLFIINGIICMMLTPGNWLATGNFWDGFFNPTFWPSLALRTGICVLLAGIFTIAVASRENSDDARGGLIRYNTIWALIGLAIIVPSFFWYWKAIPADITTRAFEMMPTPISSMTISFWFLGMLGLLLVFFGLLIPKRLHIGVAVILLALGFGFFGGFEWMRESIRKPYAIHGYMYGNAVELAKEDVYRQNGYLSQIVMRTGDDGADLFRHLCRSCHTIGGYKPLKPAFDGTDPAFIAAVVKGTNALSGNMPRWFGSDEEARLIAGHIWAKVDQRHVSEIHGVDGVELGAIVYGKRCGRCHAVGGYNDKSESLEGLTPDEYLEILDAASDYGEEMPDFTGDIKEKEALVLYLQTLGKGGEE